MKFCFALFLVCAALAAGAESGRDAKVVEALAQAEKFAATERWREALEAGNRLRTLCRAQHGEEHPDSALAELFLGEVRSHLGEPTLAESHFRRALAIQEKALPPEAPERVTTLTRLAACLRERKTYDEAAGLLQRALDLQTKIRGPEDVETAVAATNLARVFRAKRDYLRAAALLERSLAIQRRALGGTAPETIDGLRELAQVQELDGRFAEAELSTAERVVAAEARFGSPSSELFAALSDWGYFAERQQQSAIAEPRYRRALTMAEALLPADDPALAASLTQLGWCLRQLDRYDEALPLLQRALDSRLRRLGADHLDTAWSYRNLGWIHRLKRDYETARPLFEKALAVREQKLGTADPLTLESLSELGDLHWLRGAYDEAAELLERRRYRVEETTGPASEATTAAWHGLAIVYESAKRWPEATQAALRSLRLTEQRLGPADPRTLGEMVLLSRICQAAGALEPALTQYSRLVAWFARHPEASAQSRAELLRQYAIARLRAGQRDEAAPLFRESRRLHESAFGANDPATLRSIGDLWTYYDETRQPAFALESARELAARTAAALGGDAPATITVLDRLGQLCLTLGDQREALKAFRQALDARRRRFGDGSPELLDALAQIAVWFEGARAFATAAALRTERLGAVKRKFGSESASAAAACGDLGWIYFRQRDLVAAGVMFEQQLSMLEKMGAGENVEGLTAVARLGDVAVAVRDWPAAVKARERLAAGCDRHYGQNHRETGRAQLLLGEALLATGADSRAAAVLLDAHRLTQVADAPNDGFAARVGCALARLALRRGDSAEAERLTHAALAGVLAREESMAEALSLLGDEWAQKGHDALTESTLNGALLILTETAGDHDEHTLALLERLAILRLRLGRPGAAELLERARSASEALNGAEATATANLLGWLALARMNEGQPPAARDAARRLLGIVQNTGGRAEAHLALARELEAWTAWRAAAPEAAEAAWTNLSGLMLDRWAWMHPVSDLVAHSLAEAVALAVP